MFNQREKYTQSVWILSLFVNENNMTFSLQHEVLVEQDELDSSQPFIKGNKTHTQFEKEIESKRDDSMTHGNITYKYETYSVNADGDLETEDCPDTGIDVRIFTVVAN